MAEIIKKICMINVLANQKDNKIKIELSYETKANNAQIYLKINNKNEEYFQNTIVTNHDKTKTIFLSFEINVTPLNIKILIKEDGKIFDTKLCDNKKQDILDSKDEYIIFIKSHSVKIKPTGIEIDKTKIFDKLNYEIKKQIYNLIKHHKLCWYRFLKRKPKYYLFNDHLPFGDDNAEALFRYINKFDKKMAKNSYFVLKKDSKRIKDVKKLGKVLIYGSILHKIKYINSKMIISSHASYFDRVYNPFNELEMLMYKDIINKKFVFLQHGVITNDLHEMLNRSKIIADLFITSTNFECNSVKSPEYLYDPKKVVCTGLARFDRLKDNSKKIILIAPTWRSFLTDAEYSNENKTEFEKSEFYIRYKQLLLNEELQKCISKYNYKIKFLLHPVLKEYKGLMNKFKNKNTLILNTSDVKYSELFNECRIFITDYSSTHFDVAYLKKPIIYYQFDKEHYHYKKGYFDYKKDAFGQVIEDEENLVKKIMYYLKNNCKIEEKYYNKIVNTFKYLDQNNCARIYEQIKLIDVNEEINYRFNNVH